MLKKARDILSALLSLVLVLLIAVNLYSAYARKFKGEMQPTVLGYSAAVVMSGSMSGSIEVDDLIITKSEDDYQVQDIIMFRSGRGIVTHRIVDIEGGDYVTRGDANNAPDAESVSPADVVGRVVLVIPRLGLLTGYLRTPQGLLGVTLLVLLISLLPGTLKSKDEGGKFKDEKA